MLVVTHPSTLTYWRRLFRCIVTASRVVDDYTRSALRRGSRGAKSVPAGRIQLGNSRRGAMLKNNCYTGDRVTGPIRSSIFWRRPLPHAPSRRDFSMLIQACVGCPNSSRGLTLSPSSAGFALCLYQRVLSYDDVIQRLIPAVEYHQNRYAR